MRAARYALVSGGGTGGHLVPALAVADSLARQAGPGSVELVGSRRGLDAELVVGSGIPATLLPGRGIVRRLSPRALAANAAALAGLALALAAAVVVVARRRPSVVVAMGGYACLPTALAAVALRVPVVLVNVDAVPGSANRLVGRFARAAAVAFEGTALPRAVVTGAPVRGDIVAAARPDAEARRQAAKALGLPAGRTVVAVVGGSLGARRLNEATLGLARLWAERDELALYHVVGRRDATWAAERAPSPVPGGLRYVQVPFEDRMALFYQAADVVVCRSGANTVAELAVVGVPSVLVPLPGAPGDHQRANAGVLERAGGAIVLGDDRCTPEGLAAALGTVLGHPGRLAAMAAGAAALGRPDALGAVTALVRREARPGRGRGRVGAG